MVDSNNPLNEWREKTLAVEHDLNQIILGLRPAIRSLLISIFSRGHVLLEGNVGVGKTTLLRAAARSIGGSYQRIEGTIDLMPQDLIYHTYIDSEGKPKVEPGPLLSAGESLSVFFFNEINRARPQVHSLLLRVMAERSISAFNREFAFPHLQVFADRNAVEKEETFELPGAARDRFLMEIEIKPEERSDIHKALTFDTRFHNTDTLISSMKEGALDFEQITKLAPLIQQEVSANDKMQDYVDRLRQATNRPQEFGISIDGIEMPELMIAGMGPRGSSMLVRAAKVSAWLNGRFHLQPEDISSIFHEVVAHRLFFSPIYELQRHWLARAFTSKLIEKIPSP